ncbi:1-acyl-sn-glycerol-3-phosphate acyltransferase [Hyunsoonleella rubra]|uniref:1-acyl-sn-glycerol-3-phosphate acyltransferase n=1 Tax=Hyunsoonleella rubra TaxID=1737062 RepID=A0ABW5T9C4_9FLAO
MRRRLAKFIYFKILGWQVDGHYKTLQSIKKAVIIAVPHTSWHDFYIGILVRGVLGIKVNFVGKKELFVFPFGFFFRALGGRPIDRHNKQNKVQAIAQVFESNENFKLAMAPEGTRRKVEQWRTGFYYIAKEANVPIVMFTLDFENKKNTFSKPFYPTSDVDADFKFMYRFFKGVKGKIPEYS